MATSYMICPLDAEISGDAEDLHRVNVDELAHAIHQRWPQAQVIHVRDPKSPVLYLWHLDLGRGPFVCRVPRSRTCLWIEGAYGCDNATVAVWFRGLVPAKCRLMFFHPEEFPRRLELLSQTTEQDVIDFVGGPFA